MNESKTLKALENELALVESRIIVLEKGRKYYKLQSEWHRMMYSFCLEKEMIARLISDIVFNQTQKDETGQSHRK